MKALAQSSLPTVHQSAPVNPGAWPPSQRCCCQEEAPAFLLHFPSVVRLCTAECQCLLRQVSSGGTGRACCTSDLGTGGQGEAAAGPTKWHTFGSQGEGRGLFVFRAP